MEDIYKIKDNSDLLGIFQHVLNIDQQGALRFINDAKLDLGDFAELSLLLKKTPPKNIKTLVLSFLKRNEKSKKVLTQYLKEENIKLVSPMEAAKHKQNLEKIANSAQKNVSVEDDTGTKSVEQELVGLVDDDNVQKAIVKDPITKKTQLTNISQVKEIVK